MPSISGQKEVRLPHCKGAMSFEQKFCSEFLSPKSLGFSTFFEQNFCSINFFLNKSRTTYLFPRISQSTCVLAEYRNILRVHSAFCSEFYFFRFFGKLNFEQMFCSEILIFEQYHVLRNRTRNSSVTGPCVAILNWSRSPTRVFFSLGTSPLHLFLLSFFTTFQAFASEMSSHQASSFRHSF